MNALNQDQMAYMSDLANRMPSDTKFHFSENGGYRISGVVSFEFQSDRWLDFGSQFDGSTTQGKRLAVALEAAACFHCLFNAYQAQTAVISTLLDKIKESEDLQQKCLSTLLETSEMLAKANEDIKL